MNRMKRARAREREKVSDLFLCVIFFYSTFRAQSAITFALIFAACKERNTICVSHFARSLTRSFSMCSMLGKIDSTFFFPLLSCSLFLFLLVSVSFLLATATASYLHSAKTNVMPLNSVVWI